MRTPVEHSFSLVTNGTPAYVFGHLFEVTAGDAKGRPIGSATTDHAIELSMVEMESGVHHTRITWSTRNWGTTVTTLLAKPAVGHGLAEATLYYDQHQTWEDSRGRTRTGITYRLAIIVPIHVGEGADAKAADERARLAEARRKDLLNAMQALLRRHQ